MNFKNLDENLVINLEKDFSSLKFLHNETLAKYKVDDKFIRKEGRYGMVLKLKSISRGKNKTKSFRAIKFLKPEKFLKQSDSLEEFLRETLILSTLNHPNIPKIYETGVAEYTKSDQSILKIPYYVMEFIDGITLKDFISQESAFSIDFLMSLMGQILDTIKSCFNNKKPILHLDIKPDNILVYEIEKNKYRFYLTDFGKGKIIQNATEDDIETYIDMGGGEFDYVHPYLQRYLRRKSVKEEIFNKHINKYDLYSAGKVFSEVFSKVTEFKGLSPKRNPWQFFIDDLTHDFVKDKSFKKRFIDLNPKTAYDAFLRLDSFGYKIELPFDARFAGKGKPILRIPADDTIKFPPIIRKIVDTPEFQRLRGVKQLGLTHLTFPGATHDRFTHSLGVYYRATEYLNSLTSDPLFSYLFTKEEIETTALYALLHDIGHYPFAHYFEEKNTGKISLNQFHHESIGKKILEGAISYEKALSNNMTNDFFGEKIAGIKRKSNDGVKSLSQVLKENIDLGLLNNIINASESRFNLLKEIVSGPLDADKLDYLIRDSLTAGVPYGKTIDENRLFECLCIINDNNELHLGVTAKGRPAVESIMAARYELFTEVYWHKTSRAATSMVKLAFELVRRDKNIDSQFQWAVMMLDDKDFLNWLSTKLEDEISSDLLGGLSLNSRKIYKRLRTYADTYKTRIKQVIFTDFMNISSKPEQLEEIKKSLIAEINKNLSSQYQIKYHHIIIDVPSNSADRGSDIKVQYPPNVGSIDMIFNLKDVSPIGKSLGHKLPEQSKKVRIFVHPDKVMEIKKLGDEVDEIIRKCLK